METYLTVMVSVLVLTQIVRVIQNAIALYRQNESIEKAAGWVVKNDVKEMDFDVQRAVFYMMYAKLQSETGEWGKIYKNLVKDREQMQ